MKIRKMLRIISILLAVVMCFGATCVNAAAPTQTTVPETAYMKRIAASELPFEFVIEASNSNNVSVSYNRTVLLIPVNEIMYINDKISGDIVEAVDGCFELEYNKVYKFSYQYENGVLKYCYDGELSYACSDNMPIISIDNLYLNSMSKVDEQGGISLNSTTAASAGSMYESESNDSYYVADLTYDNYDNYGKISTGADEDWWKITFAHEGKANFWLGNIPSGCDYDLMVYDSTGTTIVGASISAGSASELISGLEITAGTYYMRVLWGEDGFSDTNYYLLRANWTFKPGDVFTIQNVGLGGVGIYNRYDGIWRL